jgi:hypothetical protein
VHGRCSAQFARSSRPRCVCVFECLRLYHGRAKDVETCDKRVSAPLHTHAVASTSKREPRQTRVFALSACYIGLHRPTTQTRLVCLPLRSPLPLSLSSLCYSFIPGPTPPSSPDRRSLSDTLRLRSSSRWQEKSWRASFWMVATFLSTLSTIVCTWQ